MDVTLIPANVLLWNNEEKKWVEDVVYFPSQLEYDFIQLTKAIAERDSLPFDARMSSTLTVTDGKRRISFPSTENHDLLRKKFDILTPKRSYPNDFPS